MAIVIPTYNNAATLGQVLTDVLAYSFPVIVVNDGSTDRTSEVLTQYPEVRVISYPKNRGKGYALNTGLKAAMEAGYRYAITLDSDGQHYADDIPVFLKEIERHPDSLLIGARNLASDNMPGKNTFANKFSNFWFTLETGIRLSDTQSGYRLYPLHKPKKMHLFTTKYEYELEIIVHAAWRNIRGGECSGESVLPTGRRTGQPFPSVAGLHPYQFAEFGACNYRLAVVLAQKMRAEALPPIPRSRTCRSHWQSCSGFLWESSRSGDTR